MGKLNWERNALRDGIFGRCYPANDANRHINASGARTKQKRLAHIVCAQTTDARQKTTTAVTAHGIAAVPTGDGTRDRKEQLSLRTVATGLANVTAYSIGSELL